MPLGGSVSSQTPLRGPMTGKRWANIPPEPFYGHQPAEKSRDAPPTREKNARFFLFFFHFGGSFIFEGSRFMRTGRPHNHFWPALIFKGSPKIRWPWRSSSKIGPMCQHNFFLTKKIEKKYFFYFFYRNTSEGSENPATKNIPDPQGTRSANFTFSPPRVRHFH